MYVTAQPGKVRARQIRTFDLVGGELRIVLQRRLNKPVIAVIQPGPIRIHAPSRPSIQPRDTDMERPVKLADGCFVFFLLWDAAWVTIEAAVATVDHSDIRGSKPHNHDPSGAASD